MLLLGAHRETALPRNATHGGASPSGGGRVCSPEDSIDELAQVRVLFAMPSL